MTESSFSEDLGVLERDLAQVLGWVRPDYGFVHHLESDLERKVVYWGRVRDWAMVTTLIGVLMLGGMGLWLVWRAYHQKRRSILSSL